MGNISRRMARTLLYGLPLLAMAANPVCAQTAATDAAAGPTTSAGAADDGSTAPAQLEEITVTAQRRSENLQRVPISISAVTAQMAKQMGINSSTDLAIAAPAVNFAQSNGGANITIRGIGGSGAAADEAANAVYIDGVYQASVPGLVFNLNNVERIEVEKGPQGTLFGRNSSGGLIQIITRDPSQTPAADVSAGYGNYDTQEEQLYITGPITTGLAADLAVYNQQQGEGWGRNTLTGVPTYKGRALAGRSKWLWNIDDNTSAKLSLMLSQTKPAGAQGGAIVAGQTTKTIGGVSGLPNAGFYNTTNNDPEENYVKQGQVALTLDHSMSWARAVSITSWGRTNLKYLNDVDFGPAPYDRITIQNPVAATTQELQLLSPETSAIKWATGLYYYHNSLGFTPFTQVGAVIPAAAQFQTNQTTSFSSSYSAYGQVTAPVHDKTNLTAGLRYTIDDHFEESATYTALGESGILNRSTRTKEPTYRLAVDHQFSDTLLGYVSDNRGFHGGLYNTASPAQPFVAPEVVNAYEIGLKTELFDRRLRLNMAGFYNRLKDFQVKTLASNGAGVLLNAPQAVLKGVDVDFSAARIHGLQIQGGMSYLNGTFTNFTNAPFYSVNPAGGLLQRAAAGNADGKQTPFSASWVASLAADYQVATPIGTLTLTLSNYYNGGFYFDPQNRVSQKAYDLLNSSLNWTSNSGKAELSFWARNLLNKKYYTFVAVSTAGDEYYPGAPLTFGFTASYHF